jgi:hypothetical protein
VQSKYAHEPFKTHVHIAVGHPAETNRVLCRGSWNRSHRRGSSRAHAI